MLYPFPFDFLNPISLSNHLGSLDVSAGDYTQIFGGGKGVLNYLVIFRKCRVEKQTIGRGDLLEAVQPYGGLESRWFLTKVLFCPVM